MVLVEFKKIQHFEKDLYFFEYAGKAYIISEDKLPQEYFDTIQQIEEAKNQLVTLNISDFEPEENELA